MKSTPEYQIIKDNYTINSFGFGNDHDPKLMTAISGTKDGNFYFIQQLDTLDECFVDALGGLVSVVAEKIALKVYIFKIIFQVSCKAGPPYDKISIAKFYG